MSIHPSRTLIEAAEATLERLQIRGPADLKDPVRLDGPLKATYLMTIPQMEECEKAFPITVIERPGGPIVVGLLPRSRIAELEARRLSEMPEGHPSNPPPQD